MVIPPERISIGNVESIPTRSRSRFSVHFEADMIMMGVRDRNPVFVFLFGDPIARFLVTLRLYERMIAVSLGQTSTRTVARLGKFLVGIHFRRLSMNLGFTIPPNVFGPGLRIPHYGTIVVNHHAKVGACCVLHTGTCIAGGESKLIGNALYLSTGAVVAGKIELGDNVMVGANSFVNRSFPEGNALLAGAPAKQVKTRSSWYDGEGDDYKQRAEAVFRLLEANSKV